MYTNKKSKHIKFHTDIEVSPAVMLSVNLRWLENVHGAEFSPNRRKSWKNDPMLRILFYFTFFSRNRLRDGRFFPLKQLKMIVFSICFRQDL